MKQLIVSFISVDRVGLVDTLSSVIKQHQGNWQLSSMHHISGFFAGVIEISVQATSVDALITDIKAIDGLKATIELASSPIADTQASIILELTANDRAGIVQEISSVIHHRGGNLMKLVSTRESAAHSGQSLFKAKLTVMVNKDSIDDLIENLESLANDLVVDISK